MEQQTESLSLIGQGNALLSQGQVQEAAAEFSKAVALDPNAAGGHLGIAKAYFAQNSAGYVYIACQHVLKLAPGTSDAHVAQALLYAVERRFDAAVLELDAAERMAPGQAYVHALRAYCFRQLGNSFDAMSAESKAARLSGNRDWKALFPPVEPPRVVATPPAVPNSAQSSFPAAQRSPIQRRLLRMRFATRGVPVATFTLMAINIAVYLVCAVVSGDFFTAFNGYYYNVRTQALIGAPNPIYGFGIEQGVLIQHDPLQIYRVLTSMFLHESLVHIGLNMLSLYFVGVITEQIFGARRFLIIYFVGGIIGGMAQAILVPVSPALGASGAIFAIFGAFGAFLFLHRQAFGAASGSIIGQYLFWLALNLYFSFTNPNIGLYDHLGGLITGLVLGALLATAATGRSRR